MVRSLRIVKASKFAKKKLLLKRTAMDARFL